MKQEIISRRSFLIAPVIFAIFISCARVDIAIRDELRASAPKTIMFGEMENRVLDFNPFVVKNFSDALAFEFFSRGYTVKRHGKNGGTVQEIMTVHGADLFITGSIFEARFGDAIDDRTSTAIELIIFNNAGTQAGSCRIMTNETLADARAVRSVARRLVEAIHNMVRSR